MNGETEPRPAEARDSEIKRIRDAVLWARNRGGWYEANVVSTDHVEAAVVARALYDAGLRSQPASEPTSALDAERLARQRGALRGALERIGFEPPSLVCRSCGHWGSEHDLGNWCLVCPRPETWDRNAKSPTGSKVDAGWCYFSSMSSEERWVYALDELTRSGVAARLSQPADNEAAG